MRQDLRDAIRALRRAPVFTLVAVALLALAIGSSTAVFSVVDTILLRGLPYENAGRLHAIYERNASAGTRVASYPTFLDWQQQHPANGAIEGMAFVRGDGVSIPNAQGRVLDPARKTTVTGEYNVGWIKRGPSGIIGTNKPDAQETVNLMFEDAAAGNTLNPSQPSREAVEALLRDRGVDYVTFADWLKLDQAELERGQAINRPRLKFSRVDEMLQLVREQREQPNPAGD